MAYGYFKNLNRRAAADKILREKFDQLGLTLIVYRFFDKKNFRGTVKTKLYQIKN